MKSGNLNFMEPSGPLQACNGIALPFTWLPKRIYVLNIDSVVERASGRFVGGCEGGGGVRRFPFFCILLRLPSSLCFEAYLFRQTHWPAVHAKHVRCHSHICSAMQSEKHLFHGSIHRHSIPEQTFQQAPVTRSFWMNFTWSYPHHPFWNVHEPSEDIRKPQCSTPLRNLFWTFAFSIRSIGFLRNALAVRES